MFEINEDVVFVEGAKNGAIYNFSTHKVYSINRKACDIIGRYVKSKTIKEDEKYLEKLKMNNLISSNFSPRVYSVNVCKNVSLEMAWIEITQKCNLKCLHCYEGNSHLGCMDVLSIEEWKDIIDQLARLKIKRLIIIGGEPGCYINLIELINYVSQYNINVTLFTNATCFTDKLLECVIKNNIRVKVSVYGHKEEIHDTITGVQGSFFKMTKAVKYLVDNGIKVYSAVIIMKENEDYVDDIISFVKSIGMQYSRYDVIRKVFGGTQNSHIPTKKKVLEPVYLRRPNFKADKIKFQNNMIRNTCWYGKISIMENGDVIPCEFERNLVYGNTRIDTIKNIINKESTLKNWFLDFSNIEDCKECEYRFACNDCRPIGISVCGNIHSKNPRCCYDVKNGIWKE